MDPQVSSAGGYYRACMPTVQVNDLSKYYELHGTGAPVVLIGGLGAPTFACSPRSPGTER